MTSVPIIRLDPEQVRNLARDAQVAIQAQIDVAAAALDGPGVVRDHPSAGDKHLESLRSELEVRSRDEELATMVWTAGGKTKFELTRDEAHDLLARARQGREISRKR